jgi:8-oxo-dGTP pyrophosphatase MutT (NUDIX family)
MTDTATKPTQETKPQRHKVTGDVHLLLRRGNEVLLGQRQNTGFEDGAWHLPSGHLEADESVVDALIREAEEEIGVTIAPDDVHFCHIMHNSSSGGRMAFFFEVQSIEWSVAADGPTTAAVLASLGAPPSGAGADRPRLDIAAIRRTRQRPVQGRVQGPCGSHHTVRGSDHQQGPQRRAVHGPSRSQHPSRRRHDVCGGRRQPPAAEHVE